MDGIINFRENKVDHFKGGFILGANKDVNNAERETLTTRHGHPVMDNQNIRTIGKRGPATLENYHFIEDFPF